MPIGQSANERPLLFFACGVCARPRISLFRAHLLHPLIFMDAENNAESFLFFMDAVNQIVSLRSSGMKFGTERTRALLDRLGSPDDRLKIIHVAGTNGKGSVCAYLTQILLCAGKRVGTYTTPEVFSFEEQFLIDGKTSAALTQKYLQIAIAAAEGMEDSPTAYERQTAAALAMFAGEGCEYAVVECCMGGLYDTTNAVNKKVLAVITSISLEHTAFLGDTIAEICRHKAGIIRDCPAIVSPCVQGEAREYFQSLGAAFAGEDLKVLSSDIHGSKFTCGGVQYSIRMVGCRQPYNAATAIAAAQALGIERQYIRRGIAQADIAGRLQVIERGGRTFILDGAHNPESFIPLCNLLDGLPAPRTVVYGCLSDKDIGGVIPQLARCAERIVAVPSASYRAMDTQKILDVCRRHFAHAERADSVAAALAQCKGGVIAVCGTFTILKEAEEWIGKGQ